MTPRATLLLCFAVGVVARIPVLATPSLWVDEANTLTLADGGPVGLVGRMAAFHEQHPPLYYLLLSAWMQVVGDGEAAVRLLSVLVGALPVTCLLARELAPGHELRAGLVAALAPGLVNPSQDLRMYGLLVTLAALVTWLWIREPGTPGRFAALTIATLLLLSTHLVGLFLGAALGLVGLAWPAAGLRARIGRVAPLVAGLVLYVPWLVVVARQWGALQGYFGWNVAGSLKVQVLRVAPYALLGDLPEAFAPERATQLAVVALLALGGVRLLRAPETRGRAVALLAAASLAVLLPALLAALTSPTFNRRYFSFLGVPGAILLAVACAPVGRDRGSVLGGRAALAALLGIFVAVLAVRQVVPRNLEMHELLTDADAILEEGEPLMHVAPGATPQDSFVVGRRYRPDVTHCIVPWEGWAFPPEAAAYVGDACSPTDVAAAAEGRDRIVVVLSGLAPASGALPSVKLESSLRHHARALSGALPPGWRVRRAHAYHLVELAEAAP